MGLIPHAPAPEYRTGEVVAALSHALDLVEGQPVGHAQRTCLIALEVGRRVGLGPQELRALYYAVLLKDSGCSSSTARMFALFGTDDLRLKREIKTLDWSDTRTMLRYAARNVSVGAPGMVRAGHLLRLLRRLAGEGSGLVRARCERGAQIVRSLDLPADAASAVSALDEHWDGAGQPLGLAGEAIPPLARVASLAQTAEVFVSAFGPEAAADMVRERRGRWFAPEAADAFLAIGPEDPLWDEMRDDALLAAISLGEPGGAGPRTAGEEWLDRVAEAFATVIDAKSPYTARHSEGVARYAVAIGERLGLAAPELRELRRAGLLHDIGKLGLSNGILDKPGRLTDEEMAQVREHPRHTKAILGRVGAFAPIVAMAASHHEKLDGTGYHLGLTGEHLSLPARVLAVADIYEALTAERPYRAAMEPDAALAILARDAGPRLCARAVDALRDAVRVPCAGEDVALRGASPA